ncbi:TPA: hypothetical protein SBJ50_002026 [Yersinia enterocolitica]|nr:hypothetical protein [Yersinia enterocolitica]HEF8855241.1 hypothetical protein [Yersinia enterocolitica]HEN3228731.1 hypothetical protein [Yersinia enterocolitica]HEN3380319.1 hypothetical protein [Yersinia enterocolitica]HEN3529317.1 hypothetical protein [Yersinia enterocolitica]
MNIYDLSSLKRLSDEPDSDDDLHFWYQQREVCDFLSSDESDEYILLYASLPHVFLHAIFLPDAHAQKNNFANLIHWSGNPYSSWGGSCSSDDVTIENPLSNFGDKSLTYGEQIIFARSFEGVNGSETYYEINQKIAHSLDLHYVSERKSWCKLDSHGEIDEVIKIVKISVEKKEVGTIICAKNNVLGEYAGIENHKLFRMFDFTRYKTGEFNCWGSERNPTEINSNNIFGSLTVVKGVGSYSRGFQLSDIAIPKSKIISNIWGSSEEEKNYCSYIAQDWKNKEIKEISCNPSCLANYFTESDLPFEITPAFFKPEVLLKYKTDRDRYTLNSRSVYCRGAWELKTFDVNSAGQVHTYLIYLSHLPYEEQLHWKQYNEPPKAPISKRAMENDIEGKWSSDYDALLSLKDKLEKLNAQGVPWWKLRDKNAPDKVHYPYTSSRDEWAEEILNLDQLIVEGLEEKWLRRKAKDLELNPDARLRALKLIEVILVGVGFEAEHAREIMTPFHVVHNARSILKGHTLGQESEELRKNAITEYGSYKNHYEKICANCDESLEIITNALSDIA